MKISHVIIVVLFFILPLLVTMIGQAVTIHDMKKKAVAMGAATWVVNPDNGETRFTWLEK